MKADKNDRPIILVPNLKPRDPNQQILANKKNAGGKMRDKKKEQKMGIVKYKARSDRGPFSHLTRKDIMAGNPFDFAPPIIKFKKLDDDGKGDENTPYTSDEVMAALAVLHKMLHVQAEHYGGVNGKLHQAGIVEGSLLQMVTGSIQRLEEETGDRLEGALTEMYKAANNLLMRIAGLEDRGAIKILIELINSITNAMDIAQGR